MVSFLHEAVLELVRNHPAFVADVLREVLHVQVPSFTEARLTDPTLNQPVPAEYHADAVVLLVETKPVFGVIVEAQLAPDARKLFTWPLYAVSARARHECPFVVIVVTPHSATARWAAQPIDLGDNVFRVQVIGPEGIPVVTDAELARREPELAILSALAHGRGDGATAIAVARAAASAISVFSGEYRVLCSRLLASSLSGAARKAFSVLIDLKKTFQKTFDERQFERGQRVGLVGAILTMLEVRGLKVRDDQRMTIEYSDVPTLTRWVSAVVTVDSVDALLQIEP